MGYHSVVKTKTKKAPVSKKASDSAAAARAAAGAARAETAVTRELESIQNDVRPVTPAEREPIDEWVSVPCPFCGEAFEIHVTSDEEGQTLFEDCEVCCRSVSLSITFEDGEVQVGAHRS